MPRSSIIVIPRAQSRYPAGGPRMRMYLGRRHPKNGKIEFPGGKALEGEHPRWTAFRECVEETGLTPASLHFVFRGQHTTEHPIVGLVAWDCHFYVATLPFDSLTPWNKPDYGQPQGEDGEEWDWFTEAQLTGPDAHYPDIVSRLFASRVEGSGW